MMKLEYFMGMLMIILLMIMYLMGINYLHPIILIILMIMYSLVVCLLLSINTYNYMYSIMFFLIMISGLLIIFLYFASLVSNEENKIKVNLFILNMTILNLMIMFYFMGLMKYKSYYSMEINKMIDINMSLFNNILKIYYYPFNSFTLLCLFYLLITLFVVIKICSIQDKSLRKLN
uniref:NADH dehydrogenase subunit 6 n=1 Tax=Monomorium pharaonis TaxID=307658 RepID=A0A7L8EZS6_MONPH|nr:NADH dehydrogenase subunit 6 [Monomorium pharaonis]QOE17534.1 NADH dehydrogenase subunit 6 [Monomorium pharaonis]